MERKEIVNHKGFFIDIGGNVYDASGNKRNTYLNNDGYISVSI